MSHINVDLSKWEDKTQYQSSFRLVNRQDNVYHMEFDTVQFTVVAPTQDDEMFFIDGSAPWIDKSNTYCISKKPTDLSKLLLYIEKCYKKQAKKNQAVEEDLVDDIDNVINSFDYELHILQNTLVARLPHVHSNITTGSNKAQQLFKEGVVGHVIINELISNMKTFNNSALVSLVPVANNPYCWQLFFKKDGFNQLVQNDLNKIGHDGIEIIVDLHDKLYPAYPPAICYKSPKLKNRVAQKIPNLRMVKLDYWTPDRSLEYVIRKLHEVLDKHAVIDTQVENNDITRLEQILFKLASVQNDDTDDLDDTVYTKVGEVSTHQPTRTNPNASKTYWKKGTGYGHNGNAPGWDIDKYLTAKREQELIVTNVIQNTVLELQQFEDDVYDILDNSCLIPYLINELHGLTMLDVNNRSNFFTHVFALIQNICNESLITLFDQVHGPSSLYTALSKLGQKAESVKKLANQEEEDGQDMYDMIITVYWMAKSCYDVYLEHKKNNIHETQDQNQDEDNESKTEISCVGYVEALQNMTFDSGDIIKNCYKYKNRLNTVPGRKLAKRIASEYGTVMENLPVHENASIFFRSDENDLRAFQVMITGPDDTPYDSGCYIFNFLIKDDYPNGPPEATFSNNGGQRFNPNLYNCGKVCLSLLGTWRGQKSESWNPDTSTLTQLFLSIQSQILVEEPYFNEPGQERCMGTDKGDFFNLAYNVNIRLYNMKHTMLDLLKMPEKYPAFKEVVQKHFYYKKEYVLKICQQWVDEAEKFDQRTTVYKHHQGLNIPEDYKKYHPEYVQVYEELKQQLAALTVK